MEDLLRKWRVYGYLLAIVGFLGCGPELLGRLAETMLPLVLGNMLCLWFLVTGLVVVAASHMIEAQGTAGD